MSRSHRLLIWFVLLTTVSYGYGQTVPDSLVCQINYSIQTGNSIANRYWRFRAGDSLTWANPAYDDQRWTAELGPNKALINNKALWQQQRGWFRVWLKRRPEQARDSVVLILRQLGRSEWYLDGKKLAAPGYGGTDTSANQRVTQFVPLPIADTNAHLLAVRYQFRREPVLNASFDQEAFGASFMPPDEGPRILLLTDALRMGATTLLVGIFGVLALLHFLFYRTNKSQAINRILGWEMLFFALSFTLSRLVDSAPSLTVASLLDVASLLANRLGLLLLLTAMYRYLSISPGWFYYTVAGLLGLVLAYGCCVGDLPYGIDTVVYLTLGFAYLRLAWIARRRTDTYSRLPWVSIRAALCCLAALLLTAIAVGLTEVYVNRTGSNASITLGVYMSGFVLLIVVIGLLSVPVGLSLSLVQDYARTHRTLVSKLGEVEQLSARTLAQEQEKQALLAQQNETLERLVRERTAALDQSLTDLRATQDQLIQREKLASLGELTAGVAHEIQNPLNFVNNFSEVSVELIAELEEEQTRPAEQRDETLEQELMADLKQNMGKISEHGRRAASIVRGMLQHSRVSNGQREIADLNALADEYLKLAYHGLRASDKTFEVSLVTQFEPGLPAVSVVPSDLGRVLMNLLTNAFHAVRDRTAQSRQEHVAYAPTVTLTTESGENNVRIRVRDNGSGIPEAVRSKIFQPFFTTKPTGQGTGLGLSISYDIVTKGHGGTLTVQSEPGQFTEFIVELPI